MGASFNSVLMKQRFENVVADSRFICVIKNVKSEDDIKKFLSEFKEEFNGATAAPYAAIVVLEKGKKNRIVSDAGNEMDGLGPEQILMCLQNANMGNVVLAVMRFGSTIMGVPAIAKAYEASANKAVKNAAKISLEFLDIYELVVDYVEAKKVETIARDGAFKVLSCDYEDEVVFTIAVDTKEYKKATELLVGAFGKKVSLKFLESRFV